MHENIEGLPVRGNDGCAALDIFYLEFNDVNFYVEDEDQENLYKTILQKLFPEMRLCKIFPLKGKTNVLKHAADPINHAISLQSIYIVDKDFDDLLGIITQNKRIFYLDKYCIENYLIDENAIIDVIIETYPKKKFNEISNTLKFKDILPETINSVLPLFHLFYCVQHLDLGIKNCKSKPEEFCKSPNLWQINEDCLIKYKAKLVAEAASKGVQPPMIDPFNDPRSEPVRRASPDTIISGKFLLSMLFHYVKSKYNLGSITFDSFVFRLAKNSNLSSLNSLSVRVRTLLEN